MDIQTKVHDDVLGIFVHRVIEKNGKVLKLIGYRYKQTAFLRKPDERDEDLQTRCLETVAPSIFPPKAGLERPYILFSSINEIDDV